MTDIIMHRGPIIRPYCPGCEPNTDPMAELLELKWCPTHTPAWDGADDILVPEASHPGGSAEAGGEDNRRWCASLHASVLVKEQNARRYREGKSRKAVGLA